MHAFFLVSGLVLIALSPASGATDAGTVIDGDHRQWRDRALVHPSVEKAPGRTGQALAFSEGGLELPMDGRLSAGVGTIDLWCQLPEPWPPEDDQSLLHVGNRPHQHVTLFFRGGALVAVYKGDRNHYAALKFDCADWSSGQWHRVEFGWWCGDKTPTVHLALRIDGTLVGITQGKCIDPWPETMFVGVRGKRSPWHGLIDDLHLTCKPMHIAALEPGRTTITVDAEKVVGKCYNFWSISNFTSQHMFVEPLYRARLKQTHPYMAYVNCVRLLGGREDGRNCFYRGVDSSGKVRSDFTDLRRYLQGIVEAGYTPRIVLDNVPTAMSESHQMHKYGNTYPPREPELWRQYVGQFVQAMIDEFGRETVSRWRFRVGTEPDLYPGHWAGTKKDYMQHYDYTVDAVTRVIPHVCIGPGNILNPAAGHGKPGHPAWGLEIIDHAAVGTNGVTGETGTTMKYFSCSWYGRVGRPIDSFDEAIERIRARLDRYPRFRELPIEVAEFAVLQDENKRRLHGGDITEWGASFYAAIADRVYDLCVARVHEWAQTSAGLRHPRTRVIWMLEQMAGGQRLDVDVDGTPGARCGLIASRKNGDLWLLLYHHRPARSPLVEQKVSITVRNCHLDAERPCRMSSWIVDHDNGVWAHRFYADCRAAGIDSLPAAPLFGGRVALRFGQPGVELLRANRTRYESLSKLRAVTKDQAVQNDQLQLELTLKGHAVKLIRLTSAE